MNLIEEMQKATDHWPVEKVDPNTQAPKDELKDYKDLLPQSVIPVALLGLYHYTRSADNANTLVGGNISSDTNWKGKLYGYHSDEVVNSISSYAQAPLEITESALNHATNTAIKVINDAFGSNATDTPVATVFKDNRSNILQHLPAALQIGVIINDTTIDDRTNKMEGPMSGIMHAFEKIFSDSDANDSSKQ